MRKVSNSIVEVCKFERHGKIKSVKNGLKSNIEKGFVLLKTTGSTGITSLEFVQ